MQEREDCKFKHPKSSAPAEKEEIADSDAEADCAPATSRAKLYYPKKGGKKTKSVVFRDWVEYDDGDVSNQEFPEPVIGDFKSMWETQHAIAMVVKSGKPKRMNWPMDTGCGHGLIRSKVADKLGLSPRKSSEAMTFKTAGGITESRSKG